MITHAIQFSTTTPSVPHSVVVNVPIQFQPPTNKFQDKNTEDLETWLDEFEVRVRHLTDDLEKSRFLACCLAASVLMVYDGLKPEQRVYQTIIDEQKPSDWRKELLKTKKTDEEDNDSFAVKIGYFVTKV